MNQPNSPNISSNAGSNAPGSRRRALPPHPSTSFENHIEDPIRTSLILRRDSLRNRIFQLDAARHSGEAAPGDELQVLAAEYHQIDGQLRRQLPTSSNSWHQLQGLSSTMPINLPMDAHNTELARFRDLESEAESIISAYGFEESSGIRPQVRRGAPNHNPPHSFLPQVGPPVNRGSNPRVPLSLSRAQPSSDHISDGPDTTPSQGLQNRGVTSDSPLRRHPATLRAESQPFVPRGAQFHPPLTLAPSWSTPASADANPVHSTIHTATSHRGSTFSFGYFQPFVPVQYSGLVNSDYLDARLTPAELTDEAIREVIQRIRPPPFGPSSPSQLGGSSFPP